MNTDDSSLGSLRLPPQLDDISLRKYFTLSDADIALVEECRGPINKLGFAVQLCTLRWQGCFLTNTEQVPVSVITHLGQQLFILPIDIAAYPQDEKTRWHHLDHLRKHLGFEKCQESQRQRLESFLREEAARSPRTTTLTKSACRWLFDQRIVRPGMTVIDRLVGTAKDSMLQGIYEILTQGLTPDQKQRIDDLLKVEAREEGASLENQPNQSVSRLERFKGAARRESPAALIELTHRFTELCELQLPTERLKEVHPATRSLLSNWGYQYDVWSLRRFPNGKRYAVALAFVNAALANTVDAVIEMQDKLITSLHNKAKGRQRELHLSNEETRSLALELVEVIGEILVDDSVPDDRLRERIYEHWSAEALQSLVDQCRKLRNKDDSHLSLLSAWYGYTRQYSPQLLAVTPFEFPEEFPLKAVVEYMREWNRLRRRKLDDQAPTEFLSPKWKACVCSKDRNGNEVLSEPHYELALLSTLNEKIKSGDITVSNSRHWSSFDEYLIPADQWKRERIEHYRRLQLPVNPEEFLKQRTDYLEAITAAVEARVSSNKKLTIDSDRGVFKLKKFTAEYKSERIKRLSRLIQAQMPSADLADVLIDLDNATDFLRHFLVQSANESKLSGPERRRLVLAALIAVGCNVGLHRMASATPGITTRGLSRVADWHLTEETLKAAIVDLVNYGSSLPISELWGMGNTCSADGMRFYVPVNILAADLGYRPDWCDFAR